MYNNLYDSLSMGVIICDLENLDVIYANPFIKELASITEDYKNKKLNEFISFSAESDFDVLKKYILSNRIINNYIVTLSNHRKIHINGNLLPSDNKNCFALYINHYGILNQDVKIKVNIFFHNLYMGLSLKETLNTKINIILNMLGNYLNCSRVYIYEKFNNEKYIKKTFEWNYKDIFSSIENMPKNMEKIESFSSFLCNSEELICNNIDESENTIKEFFGENHTQSFILLPLMNEENCTGYVIADEYYNSRIWSAHDIQVFKHCAAIITSLIHQRQLEQTIDRSVEMVKSIFNSMNAYIYVCDIDTDELLFVNSKLVKKFGFSQPSELLGKQCWKVLLNSDGPCEHCPSRLIINEHGKTVHKVIRGEIKNTKLNEWLSIEDSLIEWSNKKIVHLQIARSSVPDVEFENFKYYSSLDPNTNIYVKDWGLKLLDIERKKAKIKNDYISMCYFDIDITSCSENILSENDITNILKDIISDIKKNIREADIMFHWSKSEIILLLINCNLSYANEITKKINNSIKKIKILNIMEYNLTWSIGMHEINAINMLDDSQIIEIANKKMYIQKFNTKRKKLTEALSNTNDININ